MSQVLQRKSIMFEVKDLSKELIEVLDDELELVCGGGYASEEFEQTRQELKRKALGLSISTAAPKPYIVPVGPDSVPPEYVPQVWGFEQRDDAGYTIKATPGQISVKNASGSGFDAANGYVSGTVRFSF
jgi:hypothetical protein